MVYYDEPKRVPIPPSVKREVYDRCGGRCENPECRTKDHVMQPKEGDFHHIRTPSKKPTAKTVRFYCPNCHRKAHERKTKTVRGFFVDEKVSVLKRKDLGRHDISDSKSLLKNLTVVQLKELAKMHKVTVKGKKEEDWLGTTVKPPTKAQYITAISKKVSPKDLTSSIKKIPTPEKKKKKRRRITY